MIQETCMDKQTLCKKVGLGKQRVDTYLCRPEFNHIRRGQEGKKRVFIGITPADIKRLRSLKKVNRTFSRGYAGELRG